MIYTETIHCSNHLFLLIFHYSDKYGRSKYMVAQEKWLEEGEQIIFSEIWNL